MNNAIDITNLPQVSLMKELADSMTHGQGGIRFITHQYVNTIYTPELNALYNLNYLDKKKAVDEAYANGAWPSYIFLHERPFRLQALVMLVASHDMATAHKKADGIIIQNLHDVYIDAEGLHINREVWQDLFDRLPPMHRNTQSLPDKVLLYRGTDAPKGEDRGISWTTSKERAQWFADRWHREGKPGRVRAIEVERDGVALFTDQRGEAECVYFGPLSG